MWQRCSDRWGSMTIDQLGPEMIGLVPELAKFAPPARLLYKHVSALGRVATCTSSCVARVSTPSSSPSPKPTLRARHHNAWRD